MHIFKIVTPPYKISFTHTAVQFARGEIDLHENNAS